MLYRRSPHFRRWLLTGLLAGGALLGGLVPYPASAHWGACGSDPKVWLDNGARVDMSTSVQADASLISHQTFTLHVPPGTQSIRVVYTRGADASTETVNIVADSPGGYQASALASSVDGASYSVSLSVHLVMGSSSWASASGITNQAVQTVLSSP